MTHLSARTRALLLLPLLLLCGSALQAAPAETGGATSAQLPAATDKEPRLAKGAFLVAKREMRDPRFAETVVLLLRYDENGAMGLVVNRPSEVGLSAVLPESDRPRPADDTVFLGGPVTGGELFVLLRSDESPDNAIRVVDDVFVSQSEELLDRLLREAEASTTFRVFAGYAGWAPRQLDHEVARGDWYIVPASSHDVFYDRPAELWHRLAPRSEKEWVERRGDDRGLRAARSGVSAQQPRRSSRLTGTDRVQSPAPESRARARVAAVDPGRRRKAAAGPPA